MRHVPPAAPAAVPAAPAAVVAAALVACAALLAGCATSPERFERVALTNNALADPWENTNRRIYGFSQSLDKAVVMPVVSGYRFIVPEGARRGVSTIYANAREPTYMVNAVLQGRVKSGFRAFDRLLVNGVLGLGVADHASEMGLYAEPHDFGQTLARWGVPSGPYLMIPLLGPSTLRDAFGFGVDFAFDPVDQGKNRLLSMEWRMAQLGVRGVNMRISALGAEQMLKGSADPYAAMRAAWLQNRRFDLWDGDPPVDDDDDVYDDTGSGDEGAGQ